MLTDVLRIDKGTLCVVLVDHVLLAELQVKVRPALLVAAEDGAVDLHAIAVVEALLLELSLVLLTLSF